MFVKHLSSREKTVQAVDQLMYQSKQHGRICVIIASEYKTTCNKKTAGQSAILR